MSRSKKKIIFLCAAALILTISISITMAYFWSRDSVSNTVSTTSLGIGITVAEPSWVADNGKDVMPGAIIAKDPLIKNDKEAAYARMIVQIKDAQTGKIIVDPSRANKIMSMIYYSTSPVTEQKTDTQLAAYDRVNPQFTYDAARSTPGTYYYNYNTIMSKGATGQLFSGIIIPKNWSQTDIELIGDFNLEITGQAIQAKNMSSPEQAFTALDNAV